MVTERKLPNPSTNTVGTNASEQNLQNLFVTSTLLMHGKISGYQRGGTTTETFK